MDVTIRGEWRCASDSRPATRGQSSDPLYVAYKGRLYVAHFHYNQCFYVAHDTGGYFTLLGSVEANPSPGAFSGRPADKVDPAALWWLPQAEATVVESDANPKGLE